MKMTSCDARRTPAAAARWGDPSTPPLRSAQDDSSVERASAADLTGSVGEEDPLTPLRSAQGDSPVERASAADLTGTVGAGDPSTAPLRGSTQDDSVATAGESPRGSAAFAGCDDPPGFHSLEPDEARRYAETVQDDWAALRAAADGPPAQAQTERPERGNVEDPSTAPLRGSAPDDRAEPPATAAEGSGAGLTEIPEEVEAYLRLVESDTPRQCPEQHALAAYIRRVFRTEPLIVENERLRKYLSLEKYFPFELYPWEKFLHALWLCTYKAPGLPRWKTLFCLVGRGAGKDGYIAFTSFCLISPYNPVQSYDVDICANDEEQATRPVKDAIDALELPRQQKKLNKFYYHTKELIQGRANRGVIKGRTNNPKHRDGMRSGMIVFNEIHAYQNYDNIKVFRTGMGKKAEPREGAFSSNGEISDGPLDDYLERGRRILFGGEDDNGLLPFICCLPSEELVHDPENWTMANPSLQYNPTLLQEIRDEYAEWTERPEEHGDFLTKRMGLRKGFKDLAVTDYAKVKATNRPLPDLRGWRCTVGIDFAELSDFASVTAHFRRGNERFDVCKTWICLQSKTLHRVRAPYRDWAEMRLLGGDPSTPLRSAQDDARRATAGERETAGAAAYRQRTGSMPAAGDGGLYGNRQTAENARAGTAPGGRGTAGGRWEDGQRIVELVDDVSIEPRRIAAYIRELGQVCNIKMLAMDHYRWSAMAEELRKIGFDATDRSRVKLVRPSDIMQIDPVIQECFDRGLFVWGDNPCLRWAVNNTKRIRRGKKDGTDTGNFYFGKIEAKSRKTDPFMSLVAAMCCEKELGTGQPAVLPPVGAIAV